MGAVSIVRMKRVNLTCQGPHRASVAGSNRKHNANLASLQTPRGPDHKPPTQSPRPRYSTHRTLGAGEVASGGSLGDWETGGREAPQGR